MKFFSANGVTRVIAILGTGQQAHGHLEVMLAVHGFRRVLVWGPHLERFRASRSKLSDNRNTVEVFTRTIVRHACR